MCLCFEIEQQEQQHNQKRKRHLLNYWVNVKTTHRTPSWKSILVSVRNRGLRNGIQHTKKGNHVNCNTFKLILYKLFNNKYWLMSLVEVLHHRKLLSCSFDLFDYCLCMRARCKQWFRHQFFFTKIIPLLHIIPTKSLYLYTPNTSKKKTFHRLITIYVWTERACVHASILLWLLFSFIITSYWRKPQ